MAWTAADIPDQSGRVAVVTGANGGLGLATALALAAKGAHVVMAARDQAKAAAAEAEIRAAVFDASLEIVELDLGDQAGTKAAAAAIVDAHPQVDLLVNNAGLMAMPERRTADGYEMQLGVNHLGHWTFTAALLPAIVASAEAGRGPRVVTVSSVARFTGGPVDPDDPHMQRGYRPWSAYGRAKLSNYLFGLGLQEAFERAGVAAASLVAHPGLTNSDLQARTHREGGGGIWGPFFHHLTSAVGMSTTQGATMQLRAATDPAARGGELYGPLFGSHGPAVRRPVLRPGRERRIRELWAVSEAETGVTLDLGR